MKPRSLKKLTVATLAVALWKQHDFDHDKAYGAAHVWLKNCFAEASYAQLGARMARVKHVPEISAMTAEAILRHYDRFRTGHGDGITEWRGPMRGAYRKGREAKKAGVPREECPYEDTVCRGGPTFGRAFRRAWLEGWDEGAIE